MGKLKFTLSNILFWISLIASCLLLENVAFMTNNSKGGLNDAHFFMFFALAIIGYIAYFIIEHVKNHVTIDFFMLGVLSIGFICSMIVIWNMRVMPLFSKYPSSFYVYSQDYWQQTRHSLSLLVFVISIYAILFFFNKNYPSGRKIQVLLFIIMVVCYGLIIYSLIKEMDAYVYNIVNMPLHPRSIKSLFWNSNMFGGMIVMGLCAAIGLNVYKKNAFSYISLFAFAVEIVFIGSITCVISALGILVFYFLIEIILTIKRRAARGISFLVIYLSIVVSLVVVFALGLTCEMGTFSNFCRYMFKGVNGANYHTLTDRTFT